VLGLGLHHHLGARAAHRRETAEEPVVRFGLQAADWWQAQGIEVKFEEARDAHNWENWRDRLRNGLSWLFPGPLWMVYD
jgi:enterochelin esterase family protein